MKLHEREGDSDYNSVLRVSPLANEINTRISSKPAIE